MGVTASNNISYFFIDFLWETPQGGSGNVGKVFLGVAILPEHGEQIWRNKEQINLELFLKKEKKNLRRSIFRRPCSFPNISRRIPPGTLF